MTTDKIIKENKNIQIDLLVCDQHILNRSSSSIGSSTMLTDQGKHIRTTTAPYLINCQTTYLSESAFTKANQSFYNLLLEIIDILLSCLIIAPCIVIYWRGTWHLIETLILPRNLVLSAIASFSIGAIGHLIFTFSQEFFTTYVHPDKHRLSYYIISRCYTYVFGVICVNTWRGSWALCDWLTSSNSLFIISLMTAAALFFLITTRTVRNLSATPYTLVLDVKDDYFAVDTMFQIPGFHQPCLYIIDALFSIFVIGTLVVIAWRGLWGIMDLTLYANNKTKSAYISLTMGYTTVFLSFILHTILRWITVHSNGILKLLFCNIYYIIEFFGAVSTWRGIWNLLDYYIHSATIIRTYWIFHAIPFLILTALRCSNSILVRSIYIDCDGTPEECVQIPVHYVTSHFQHQRNKKITKSMKQKTNLLISSNDQTTIALKHAIDTPIVY